MDDLLHLGALNLFRRACIYNIYVLTIHCIYCGAFILYLYLIHIVCLCIYFSEQCEEGDTESEQDVCKVLRVYVERLAKMYQQKRKWQ